MRNRYLEDRAMRRGRDGRNPYGRKGGYELSERYRRKERERDRSMGSEYYYPRYDDRNYSEYDSKYPMEDYHYTSEQHREHYRPVEYQMYGSMRPRYEDYASGDVEKKWEEDLEKWCKELKKYDKFNMPKEEILNQAHQMGVRFEDFDEKEFLTTYYMMMSDYKMDMLNSPQAYMIMAKDFLDDKDSDLKGSEKLCAYYYEIVKADED